jgi:hypothetical protein
MKQESDSPENRGMYNQYYVAKPSELPYLKLFEIIFEYQEILWTSIKQKESNGAIGDISKYHIFLLPR